MIIAQQLKQRNRAEYLLYMWQVEDILRAYDCDIDRLCEGYLKQFALEGDARRQMEEWYGNLCRMMVEEGLRQKGHLQINRICLQQLDELHRQLLASPRFPAYRAAYYKILPGIVELRSKNAGREEPELETCFEALYGVMLLRLQHKPVSEGTAAAARDISAFLARLSAYYRENEENPIEF